MFMAGALAVTLLSSGQTPKPVSVKPPPAIVAGIPVNYDESRVGIYVPPDALTLSSGKPVLNAGTWWSQRRPEIVSFFEMQQYGKAPGRPAGETVTVTEKGSRALDGKALRKQVTIAFQKTLRGLSCTL